MAFGKAVDRTCSLFCVTYSNMLAVASVGTRSLISYERSVKRPNINASASGVITYD